MKKILIVTSLIILAGCATTNVAQDYSLNEESHNGLLVGSIKYLGPLSGYKIFYQGLDNNESGYFEAGKGVMLLPIPPKSDFTNIKGKLQVVELPPGDYEISRWSVESGVASLSQTNHFSIRFKIEPGKATYIGSFIFNVTSTMGLTVTGVEVNYEDGFYDDRTVLKRKYSNLNNTSIFMGVEKGLVKKDIGGSSFTSWNMAPIFLPMML